MFNVRVTSDQSKALKEVIFLEINDLEESPKNVLVRESPTSKCAHPAPNCLVQSIIKILAAYIERMQRDEEPETLQNFKASTDNIGENQVKIMAALEAIQARLEVIETNTKKT